MIKSLRNPPGDRPGEVAVSTACCKQSGLLNNMLLCFLEGGGRRQSVHEAKTRPLFHSFLFTRTTITANGNCFILESSHEICGKGRVDNLVLVVKA